jgi:hypothetical protein
MFRQLAAITAILSATLIRLAMTGFTLVRLRMKEAPGAEHREKFEPVPHQASPGALERDPRKAEDKAA